jgi:hypothetical protein
MNELSKSYFKLEVIENYDPESVSGRAWVIDLLTNEGEVILEQAGVAPTLMKAMEEAGREITLFLASQWLDTALLGEVSA